MTDRHYTCDGCGAGCRTFSIFASLTDADREPCIPVESQHLPDHVAGSGDAFFLVPTNAVRSTLPDRMFCRTFLARSDQCQDARQKQGLPPLESST